MSEFKLPPPRRLLRCEALRTYDDSLIGRHLPVFDELVSIESPAADEPDLLLIVEALVDELAISLTLVEAVVPERVAEVA